MTGVNKPIAIIGGGILGTTTALLFARAGRRVVVFERKDAVFKGTSITGEAKIHLGPVYALGDEKTALSMLCGGLSFQPIVEKALAGIPQWDELITDPFDYMVMQESLVSAGELCGRYARINALLADAKRAAESDRYLGQSLDIVIETEHKPSSYNGLATFGCYERALDSRKLAGLITTALSDEPLIDVLVRQEVLQCSEDSRGAWLKVEDTNGENIYGPFAAVINCAWHERASIVVRSGHSFPVVTNYRIKRAAIVECEKLVRNVTLVHGPFGDIVQYGDRVYVSWYPVCRIHHEVGLETSARFNNLIESGYNLDAGIDEILAPFRSLCLLPDRFELLEIHTGAILGEGMTDITDIRSGLHSRHGDRILQNGSMLTSLNYKLTTAPQAARKLCDMVLGL
jgi:hypothetical protein